MRKVVVTLLLSLIAAAGWAAPKTVWPASGEVFYSSEAGVIYVSENRYLGRQRLYFKSLASEEPRAIFESFDEIIAPRIASNEGLLIASWETRYLDRKNPYFTVSLDRGRNFGALRQPGDFLPAPLKPELVQPKDGGLVTSASPEIGYKTYSSEPVLVRLEIAPDGYFDSQLIFEKLTLPGSPESRFKLPAALPDGKYYLKLTAFDGLAVSPARLASFEIDSRLIRLSRPAASDRFKAGSTIYVEATLNVSAETLEDESEAEVSLDNIPLQSLLVCDAASVELSGFVTLPSDLTDGRYEGKVSLRDRSGRLLEQVFSLNLGNTPPSTGEASDLQSLFYPVYNRETRVSGLITGLAAGPVPYSPGRDGSLYFTFSFSTAVDRLALYIFDLAGTLVWKKELNNVGVNSVAWNGIDLFGRNTVNGVYPYLAAVTAGGQTEIKRGKIIVLR